MFIGNQKLVQFLSKAIENNKLSQTYLFSGPENAGKFTLAKIFARSVIKGSKFDFGENDKMLADMIILEPEIEEKKGVIKEKEIKVEQVRNIQKDLSLFPYDGKYKVLIINNAHKMSISAQNALLKILEEPNATSIIILVTHNDSKIISTIKSRCQKINFSLVDVKEIKEISSNDIANFSMGRPGMAMKMIENTEELDIARKEFEYVMKFSDIGMNERLKLAEKMSSDGVKSIKRLEFWMWIIRLEVLKDRKNGGFFSFETIEKIEKSLEMIKNTNANVRLVIENLFLEI